MTAEPIYASPPRAKSLWQRYEVYPDRIELHCWWFLGGKYVIRAEDLVSATVRPPVVGLSWALKLDLADFRPHVALRRERGFFRELRVTPDDPEAFVAACGEITSRSAPG